MILNMLTNVWNILPSFILLSIVYINKFFFKRVLFHFSFAISLWFLVFGRVGFSMWLDELVGFLFFEILGDLLGGVSGHSFFLLGIELNKSSSAWCWLGIGFRESWNSISDSGGPVLKILSFFSLVSIGDGWLFGSQLNESSSAWCWLGIGFGESWDSISNTRWPVLEVLSLFSLISFGDGWLFSSGLGKSVSTVLESALNKVEEVSDKLCFLLLIDSFEKLSVHLSLEEFIQISLKISLKESLFSKSNLMHVRVHAHGFNIGLHLSSRFGLELSCISRAQQSNNG